MLALLRHSSPRGRHNQSNRRGDMSNRSTHVLPSIFVLLLAGFYSQPLPIADQAKHSVTSRGPSSSDDENPSATSDDNSDDSSDDFVPTNGVVNWLPFATLV